MRKQEQLFEYLNTFNQLEGFSLGLHTTDSETKAKSICENGLYMTFPVIERTVKMRGPMENTTEEDLNWFFPYTTHTIIVGIPKEFGVGRVGDNLGGDAHFSEFSKILKYIEATGDKERYPEFFDGDKFCVPSELILGYYDKDFNFVENPKCKLQDEEYVQSLVGRIDEDVHSQKYEIFNSLSNFNK